MFNPQGFLIAQGIAFFGLFLWKAIFPKSGIWSASKKSFPVKQPDVSHKFVMPELRFLEERVQPVERIRYERIPLTKKQRFEILKRDNFTCQYCGRTPPEVVLEVDHRISVYAGGDNRPSNLITSCLECNRGKGAGSVVL